MADTLVDKLSENEWLDPTKDEGKHKGKGNGKTVRFDGRKDSKDASTVGSDELTDMDTDDMEELVD